jgi:hypothetical protein
MNRQFQKALTIARGPFIFPIFLLGVCLAAYGLLITRLGFYWDDFPINWIASTMGGEGLTRYFSTNRPVWGMIYRITTPLLGSEPLTWQIFGIFTRWLTGLALWALLSLTWRRRRLFAAAAAMLFVLYPGFSQQSTAFMYSHFYIVLTSFLLSLALMVAAIRFRRWFWPLTLAASLFSLLNMLAMEYFFLLDLIRPALIWIVLRQQQVSLRDRLKQTLLHWLPYMALFGGALFWRSVLFGFQTYQPTLMNRLKEQPVPALSALSLTILQDIWKTAVLAWARSFVLPTLPQMGQMLYLRIYWLLTSLSAIFITIYLMVFLEKEPRKEGWAKSHSWAVEPVGLGLLALVLAGGPFWLTDLPIGLVFPNDRFTLSFMLGACLLLAGLLAWLPLPRWLVAAIFGIVMGFSVGLQFQNAVAYNRDWSMQRAMFWQMVWRIPDLQPGTVLLSNELPMKHYSDNSLTAPLNWIYEYDDDPLVMPYLFYYPTVRQETTLRFMEPGSSFQQNYLAATFYGSTAQMVSIYYQPPGCLRVLDPEIEITNWMVPNYLRATLSLASLSPIMPAPQTGKPQPIPPANVFGAEISHGWCYYYAKADLARQMGDWETVAKLGDEAFAIGDYPNDPAERLPFIEGYAHTGSWNRAVELSRETRAITAVMQPVLCRLWERIEREAAPGIEKDATLQSIRTDLGCSNP